MNFDDAQLRSAVEASRSWRGVLRELGLPAASSRRTRLVRERCEERGISYRHFSSRKRWSDATLIQRAAEARSWIGLLAALGYSSPESGSARVTVRAHCERLNVDVSHLDERNHPVIAQPSLVEFSTENLRSAGSLIVASFMTLAGARVSWPLEPAPYDLIADTGTPPMLRIQVKTTTQRRASGWVCSLVRATYDRDSRWSPRQVYGAGEIDHFAIVDGDYYIFLIPYHVVAGRTSITLRKYRQFRVGRLDIPPSLPTQTAKKSPVVSNF